MPTLKIDGATHEVAQDTRLVLAIQEMGIDIGHRCGGKARCTTCRVEFRSGEPTGMTRAEFDKLKGADLFGEVRLSCQVVCSHDMEVVPLKTLQSEGWSDTGPEPAAVVEPKAKWFDVDELEAEAEAEAEPSR